MILPITFVSEPGVPAKVPLGQGRLVLPLGQMSSEGTLCLQMTPTMQ